MTIEIAPKAPAASSAKPAEGSAGQKSTDKLEVGSAKSFLAALACAEEAVTPLVADATIAPAVDPAAVGLVATDPALLQEKPLDDMSGTLPDPALLLAQATVVPVAAAPQPADNARGKSGSVAGKDGALPLQAALDSALGKPLNTPQAKSGKATLDAAAQAAQSDPADASAANTSAAATAVAAASKEATPDRIHKFVQELTASLAKAPESSAFLISRAIRRPVDIGSE